MKKRLILLIIFSLLLVLIGCSSTDVSQPDGQYIKVYWENVSSTQIQIASLFGDIPLKIVNQPVFIADIQTYEKRFSHGDGPISSTATLVTAELFENDQLVSNAQFDFIVQGPKHQINNQTDNSIMINFQEAGEGTVNIKHGALTTQVLFEVFPFAGIGNSTNWASLTKGFSFETGQGGIKAEGDIYIDDNNNVLYAPYGYTIIPKTSTDFWIDFDNLKDVTTCTFDKTGAMWANDIKAEDVFDNIYLVRTKNGGYAKLLFNHNVYSSGYAWEFVYKYSPDGTF